MIITLNQLSSLVHAWYDLPEGTLGVDVAEITNHLPLKLVEFYSRLGELAVSFTDTNRHSSPRFSQDRLSTLPKLVASIGSDEAFVPILTEN